MTSHDKSRLAEAVIMLFGQGPRRYFIVNGRLLFRVNDVEYGLAIEDDELGNVARDYLIQIGAPQFPNREAYESWLKTQAP